MIHQVSGDDINGLLQEACSQLRLCGQVEDTRNGPVVRFPGPLVTEWTNPRKRVLFSPLRDANPFFHLMESIWMLAGRNDVAFVSHYNKRIADFSDDGVKFHAPYGYRWRKHFHVDQLTECVNLLRSNPKDRRVVMAMWDPAYDLAVQGKDFPCNTTIYFSTLNHKLDMTVCNRSNDIIWGLYGANAVHMSMMMEIVACGADLELGTMYTLSNNAHFYPENFKYALDDIADDEDTVFYLGERQYWNRLVNTPGSYELFLSDCHDTCHAGRVVSPRTGFFRDTIEPMMRAWECHKNCNTGMAIRVASTIAAEDWKSACVEWLQRRMK